jgi:hypothetical protein
VNKFGRLKFSKGPDFILAPRVVGIAFGNIERIGSRLKLRRCISAADVYAMKLDMAVSVENNTLIGICVEGLSPEIKAKIPFCAVELGSVEFVGPDELPIAVGEV